MSRTLASLCDFE
ncbi:hypothetical protein F383_28840 [Gossypium arboreum]|uniref:Uncharacterized protein n=1 Tax=Gossypium arboreum TaxID=29729 RepID=A0A0B0P6Y6_GOSAR|nr:hypothetical protein F383_28840 [Gossypium arboreum]